MRTRPNTPIRRPRRPGIFDRGPSPSLSLDFMSGVLDSRITFARSTSGTYYSNGLVVTAAAGVPRFQSNPITGASEGLLIESGITNLVCGSETFATSGGANNWSDTNITRDGTLRTSPDGSANALRVTASAGNATILNNLSLSSAARTFSIWIRRVTGSGNVELTMDGGTAWTSRTITATWTRVQMTGTTTAHVGIRIVVSGDAIEIWGAQVEDQGFASSYIPTAAATVARGTDSAIITGSAFSDWYNPIQGTVYVDYIGVANTAGATRRVLEIGLGDGLNRLISGYAATTTTRWLILSGGSAQADVQVATVAHGSVVKFAGTYATNYFQQASNTILGTADVAGTVPSANQMQIGDATTLGAATNLNGTIRRIAYWPMRLPDATLRELTT